MNKFIALAALLGFAASKSVASYEKGDALVTNEWFNFRYDLWADVNYGTYYEGAGPSNAEQTEIYGAGFYVEATATVSLDILKHRQLNAEFYVLPVDFSPYEQHLTWKRFDDESKPGFHLYHAGARYISFFDYFTTINTNVKTFTVSIWDYLQEERDAIGPKKSDFGYNGDYNNKYEDPYYTGNLLEDLDVAPTASWYGLNYYYGPNKLF